MHLQDNPELWDDSIKAIHARRLVKDITQTEDDSFSKNEVGSLYTVCTSLQVADTGDMATMAPSAASICTFLINAEPSEVEIPDVGFVIHKTGTEDDFSDEYPLAIEVKPEKQQYEKEPLYRDLYRIYRECSESDWDIDGAYPINEHTFLNATILLDKLPSELPLPEVIPEPIGNIAFEWYRGKRQVYVISVGANSTIEYAGLFGKYSKTYGAEYFTGELPGLIKSHILRLFS